MNSDNYQSSGVEKYVSNKIGLKSERHSGVKNYIVTVSAREQLLDDGRIGPNMYPNL
jgi:hypothetical protein